MLVFEWNFLGLSSETKPLNNEKVIDGSTFYECDTSNFFIYYNGEWYKQTFVTDDGINVYLYKFLMRKMFKNAFDTNITKTHVYNPETSSNITFTSVLPSNITEMEMYGDSVQDGTPTPDTSVDVQTVTGEQTVSVTGKNLFSGYTKGISLNPTTGAQTTSSVAACSDYIPLDITGTNTFTISGLPTTLFNFVAAYNANKVFLGRTGAGGFAERTLSSNSFASGTPQGSGDIAYIRVTIYENSAVPGVINDIDNATIQLEAGPTATDYQPYQSQTYEINLGKNLLELANYTAGGVTTTLNSDGKITVSGTTANNYANFMAYQTPLSSPSGTYTFSRTGDNTYRVSLTLFSEDKSRNTSINIAAGSNSATATIPFEIGYVAGAYTSLTVGSELNFTTGLQLEFGSTATSYAPYFAPIELCKLGDYQDYIYKGADGWYVHKAIEKVTLTGDAGESWSAGNNNIYFFHVVAGAYQPENRSTIATMLSDYFTPRTYNQVASTAIDYGIALDSNNAGRLAIRNKDCANATALRTWLASNNTTVYYPLATPTDTKITDTELISSLDSIMSYTFPVGLNYVTVSATNLPALLKLTITEKE